MTLYRVLDMVEGGVIAMFFMMAFCAKAIWREIKQRERFRKVATVMIPSTVSDEDRDMIMRSVKASYEALGYRSIVWTKTDISVEQAEIEIAQQQPGSFKRIGEADTANG